MADEISMAATLQSISEQITGLRSSMEARFANVEQRFDRIDERFATVDQRFEKIDERLEVRLLQRTKGSHR
jgi:hypothetical protein